VLEKERYATTAGTKIQEGELRGKFLSAGNQLREMGY
jgi:hypothetical protein